MHGDIIVASICLSLTANDVDLLFVLLCHLYILSDQVSVHIFSLFTYFVRLVCLLTIEF